MTQWNTFDTDCKNKRGIFILCISFTGPLSLNSSWKFEVSTLAGGGGGDNSLAVTLKLNK